MGLNDPGLWKSVSLVALSLQCPVFKTFCHPKTDNICPEMQDATIKCVASIPFPPILLRVQTTFLSNSSSSVVILLSTTVRNSNSNSSNSQQICRTTYRFLNTNWFSNMFLCQLEHRFVFLYATVARIPENGKISKVFGECKRKYNKYSFSK